MELSSGNYTYTNEKGYFNLKRENKKLVGNLVIQEGVNVDTIYLANKSGADSKIDFLFLSSKKEDTLDLNQERIFKKQSSGNY